MFHLPETGFYLTHYRFYDPNTGRWLNRDPIGERGGLNLYGYVGGNPVNFTDPTGEVAHVLPVIVVAVVVAIVRDAVRADRDFVRNYLDMRRANTIGADKYFHCKANCEAASHGLGGMIESRMLSELRELTDEYIKGDSPQACDADRQANDHGRRGGSNNPTGLSCQQICSPLRPNGLPSNY
jgi:RHS repeat-associated protein